MLAVRCLVDVVVVVVVAFVPKHNPILSVGSLSLTAVGNSQGTNRKLDKSRICWS